MRFGLSVDSPEVVKWISTALLAEDLGASVGLAPKMAVLLAGHEDNTTPRLFEGISLSFLARCIAAMNDNVFAKRGSERMLGFQISLCTKSTAM